MRSARGVARVATCYTDSSKDKKLTLSVLNDAWSCPLTAMGSASV